MANTIRAAKNDFSEGLVMDLAPDATPNKVLTSALNATLVTFNGNELQLQNDMGNGRVETARLPEGYIPVGTCEFGDIIYIVSYNPLTNKSQIGCFPSPERNISSQETGSANQQLDASDFQEGTGVGQSFIPNGRLKASSVKKIIYNNKLNPGDKFIIYDQNNVISSQIHITDMGNTQHVYGAFPKLLKIHVIAIEDSGKINFLDSTVRWYDNGTDYFMMPTKQEQVNGQNVNVIDIDSYRDLLSSGYSVFQSKISGKLGLLIELEKINGFSCTYNIYTSNSETAGSNGVQFKDCRIYWNINWNTYDNNINPAHLVLTKSEWVNKDLGVGEGKWYAWSYNGSTNEAAPEVEQVMAPSSLPKAFDTSGYWNCDISRQYNPASNGTYLDFITTNSYDKKLEAFLNSLPSVYDNVALVKLNVARIDDSNFVGLPNNNYYYINLAKIVRQVQHNTVTYNAYTEDLNQPEMYSSISPIAITDDIVNNYFNTSISKYFASFSIPVKQILQGQEYTPNITNLIYHYEITPAMDYGILEEYAIEGYIDFSKVGTGSIDMTYWKYYNTENSSTLSIGLDAYVEENKGIEEVALEFYDNQGVAATYHIRNKESYSGTFTEFIPLNGVATSPNLTPTNSDGDPIYHLGSITTQLASNVIYKDSEGSAKPLYYKAGKAYNESNFATEHTSTEDLYINDAGTLYSNALYLVKIIVKYCRKDVMGKLDTSDKTEFKTYYRWFWTNTMYNQYYSNVSDFDTLPFILNLDINTSYSTSSDYCYDSFTYRSPDLQSKTEASAEVYKNSACTVQIVSSDAETNKNNTKYYLQAGLSNNYNTFKLNGNITNGGATGIYDALDIDICVDGDQYVDNILEDPDIIHAGSSNYGEWNGIKPVLPEDFNKTKIGPGLRTLLQATSFPTDTFYNSGDVEDLWESTNAYSNYRNTFEITDFGAVGDLNPYDNQSGEYVAYNNTAKSLQGKHYVTKKLKDIYDINHAGTFNANIIHFSKYYYINRQDETTVPCLFPILRTLQDISAYGLQVDDNGIPYIEFLYTIEQWDDENGEESHMRVRKYQYSSATSGRTQVGWWSDNWSDSEDQGAFGGHKGFFWRDNADEWRQFNKFGFFLHGLHMHYDSKYGGSCDYNPNNEKGRWFRQEIGLKWNNLYGGIEPKNYCVSRHGDDGRWRYGWEETNNHIVGIGYNGDENKLEHYFNTYFIVGDVGQNIKFAQPYSNKYPRYLGQYVATILGGLYICKGDENQLVVKTTDIVHLDSNYTTYTKDIIYKAKINSSYNNRHNELLVLQTMDFNNYLTQIYRESGISSSNVNKNNVTLELRGCIKNNPVQYKMEYIIPKYDHLASEGSVSAILIKSDGTPVNVNASSFEQDKLYQLDENNKAVLLNSNFSAQCVQSIDTSGTILKATYNDNWGRMKFPKIKDMFKWDGEKLICSYVDTAQSNANRYAMHGQEEADMAIHDFRKDEVLVPLGNMMRPSEIPI